jgi:tetratricopeptide (TPR) repeat protein
MKRSASPTASLRRAVELQPSLDSALGHLAAALLQQGREREAQLVFRKLASRADDPIERRFYSARALAMEGKTEEAEKELRRLLAQAPETAPARALLGEVLSNRGMFEEAVRHLAQAVEGFPPAFQQLTSAKRMTEADRPLVDRMRSLAERPGLDAHQRSLRPGQGLRRFGRLRGGDATLRRGKPPKGDVGAVRSPGAGDEV